MQFKKKLVPLLEWGVLGLVLVSLSFYAVNWAVKSSIHYKKTLIVPDLKNQTLPQALTALSEFNIGIRQEGTEFDESVPAGTILRQSPLPGSQVREGKIIRVTLSQGNEIIMMPSLVGLSLRQAEIALRNNQLSIKEVKTMPSLRYEKDSVIEQFPSPKTVLKRRDQVVLTVSQGQEQQGLVLMPDFVGKDFSQAQTWAQNNNIKIDRKDSSKTSFSKNIVSAQSISPDTEVSSSTLVRLTVSTREDISIAEQKEAVFKYEAAQGQDTKTYLFILVSSKGMRQLWSGKILPGHKQEIVLGDNIGDNPRIRIFINGILVEEKAL